MSECIEEKDISICNWEIPDTMFKKSKFIGEEFAEEVIDSSVEAFEERFKTLLNDVMSIAKNRIAYHAKENVDLPFIKYSTLQDSILKFDNKGLLSDGYHTFDELYEFRKLYNAALFNEWAKQPEFVSLGEGVRGIMNIPKQPIKYDVHKSWKHHDGELCFGGGWFIVVAILPTGQISNHYKAEDWDLFKIPEVDKAKYPFDGHTPKDVMERLKALL